MYLSLPLKTKLTEDKIILYSLYIYASGKKEIKNEGLDFVHLLLMILPLLFLPNKIILVNISRENSSSKLVNTQLLSRG